jgi:hypothetical protein
MFCFHFKLWPYVQMAVYMVMGANISTSVTNTIVAMGHFANKVGTGYCSPRQKRAQPTAS